MKDLHWTRTTPRSGPYWLCIPKWTKPCIVDVRQDGNIATLTFHESGKTQYLRDFIKDNPLAIWCPIHIPKIPMLTWDGKQ